MKIKNILVLICYLIFMQSYNAAPAQSQMDLSRLPLDVLVETVIQGINQADSLREAWELMQKLSLAYPPLAREIMRDTQQVVTPLVDALSKKVKSSKEAGKALFNFARTKGKIGPLAAKMITRALLKAGADKDKKKGFFAATALMNAAFYGHEGIVRELINAGADKDRQDGLGWTALMRAAEKGNEGIVKILLGARANPLITNTRGQGARDVAANDTIRKLIQEAIVEQQTQAKKLKLDPEQ